MSDLSTVIGVETDMKEFKKLQQRLNHEAIRHQFKKKVVGGLDEDDVTKYIEDLEGKFKKLEQEYKKVTDDFYSLRIKLNKEFEEKDSLLINIDELKLDLNDYIEKCRQKDLLINSLNEKYNSENIQLINDIQQISEERNELKKLLNESKNQIEQIKEYAVKFENDNTMLKDKIVDLESENSQIVQLNIDNKQLSDEHRELIRQLNDYNIEIEQLKEQTAKYISENAIMKSNLSGLEIENTQLSEQRNDLLKQMNDSESAIEQLIDKAAKFENENNILKTKLSYIEQDNARIPQLKSQLSKSQEELKSLNELLIESDLEIEQMKEYVAAFEDEEKILKAKISELEEENMKIAKLKKDNIQMSEDIKAFEELLNQSGLEYEQLKESLDKFENENKNMETQIVELNNIVAAKDYKISEINRVCQDLKQQLEIEKSCSDKLNMDLVIFKQKIISLEDTITEKLVELEEQRKISEKAEQELSMEKAKVLSYRINGFKEEFSEIYKKIENLQDEANQNLKSSNILQQQLAIQQNRADKAESDLAAFMQILTGAKDKFYSERNPFGDQFKQLVETQVVNEPIINESYLELE